MPWSTILLILYQLLDVANCWTCPSRRCGNQKQNQTKEEKYQNADILHTATNF
jgi:hypothetical protein